jgi:hypothetical protein
MGCDIHGWVEIRPYNFDKDYWTAVYDIDHLERNYLMFARLFGVRLEEIPALAPNRGLPSNGDHDAHDDWRKIDATYWEADGHSFSWIGLDEIIAHEKELLAPLPPQETFQKWQMLFNIMKELGKVYGIENVRLVAWFDN